jgi:hypothetical protein
MKSLFEEEERELAMRQLKVNLISRFHRLSKAQVIRFKETLNFGRFNLMLNSSIHWDVELLESVSEKIDWSALWKIDNIRIDHDFLKKFEDRIHFDELHYSNCIVWTEEIINDYGERLDWSKSLITQLPFPSINHYLRLKDKLDWRMISRMLKNNFELLDEEALSGYWDWDALSTNRHLPFTVEFIQKYRDKLNFSKLSGNPSCLEIIYKYSKSKRWDWAKVSNNPAVIYDESSFNFIFHKYKENISQGSDYKNKAESYLLKSFLLAAFINQKRNDMNFFLNDDFIDNIPWYILSNYSNVILPESFINKYKEKFDFKSSSFLRRHNKVLNYQFIKENIQLFDTSQFAFSFLMINSEILELCSPTLNWYIFSSNEYFNWSWDFIEQNLDKLGHFRLSFNETLYELLIKDGFDDDALEDLLSI